MEERNMWGGGFERDDDTDSKFANQMQVAGVTPLHSIAIAVSGGADSMALCLLAARWRGPAVISGVKCGGLVGLVVDHNLRSGSAEEAMRVQQWVFNLGLDCHILKCVWVDGIPAMGHLQESARNARYALLAKACQDTGAEVLLTAHHADDQAELFILRLSRCSGIAGLAGMALAMNFPPVLLPPAMESPILCSLLLIRPLLKFVKEELYKICQKSGQDWVEDPTNRNLTFTRNRIRKALQEPTFLTVRTEIQELITFCRNARSILDRDRDHLLSNVAWVSQEWGHITIDVEKLASSGASYAVLHRAVGALMQFVAQKAKAPRGRAVSSVLDRLHAKLSKGAYTVGGCNIFPAPGLKGSKVIISFSPDSPPPSASGRVCLDHSHGLSTESSTTVTRVPGSLSHTTLLSRRDPILDEVQSNLIEKAISVLALDIKTPKTAVNEFKDLGLISDTGASLLKDLASDVSKDMGKQPEKQFKGTLTAKWKSTSSEDVKKFISFGESVYFMDRFVVSLLPRNRELMKLNAQSSEVAGGVQILPGYCCLLRIKPTLWIRHFEEKDLAYLSLVARGSPDTYGTIGCNLQPPMMSNRQQYQCRCQRPEQLIPFAATFNSHKSHRASPLSPEVANYKADELHTVDSCRRHWCDIERFSKAKEALVRLQSVPKLVRRGLPVFVTAQGLLLGMPSVGYGHCPLVSMTAVFHPRNGLGGGQSSWL